MQGNPTPSSSQPRDLNNMNFNTVSVTVANILSKYHVPGTLLRIHMHYFM